jgi:molecular chaperone IbpA
MRHFDLTPLYRTTVGFDRLGSLLDTLGSLDDAPSYPPYNIELVGENAYRISMAVAGFGADDLNIEVKENTLTIRGEKKTETKDEGTTFLHRGIASRSFERRFQLADHVQVKDAALENGLLHVDLVRELPEAMKPRTVPISTKGEKPRVIDSRAA